MFPNVLVKVVEFAVRPGGGGATLCDTPTHLAEKGDGRWSQFGREGREQAKGGNRIFFYDDNEFKGADVVGLDGRSNRLNSSHTHRSRMPLSA